MRERVKITKKLQKKPPDFITIYEKKILKKELKLRNFLYRHSKNMNQLINQLTPAKSV